VTLGLGWNVVEECCEKLRRFVAGGGLHVRDLALGGPLTRLRSVQLVEGLGDQAPGGWSIYGWGFEGLSSNGERDTGRRQLTRRRNLLRIKAWLDFSTNL